MSEWKTIGNLYSCFVSKNTVMITRETAKITSISGSHNSGKTNSDVEFFRVHASSIKYFPRGVENYFKDIKAIAIIFSNLTQIHQDDLKPFSKLAVLDLFSNLLQVLEDGLFDFNPDLQRIDLSYNKIFHIAPKVFDHLSKLSDLLLSSNSCIDMFTNNSTEKVKEIIRASKAQCINSEYPSIKEQLDDKSAKSEPDVIPKTEYFDQAEKISTTTQKIEISTKPKVFKNSSNCCKFDKISILFYFLIYLFLNL
jgi:hypothetical protein